MKKILITLITLIFFSCEKEDIAYYSVNNKCRLVKTESDISTFTGNIGEKFGLNYLYNLNNQFVKKVPYHIDSEGKTLNGQAIDSVLYRNGYPSEAFYKYSEGDYYIGYHRVDILRHEEYSFTGSQLTSINFTTHDEHDYKLIKTGVTKYMYENSKIITSTTIEDVNYSEAYNTYTSYMSCDYHYFENNLINVKETKWHTFHLKDRITEIIYSDTVYVTKTYSDYSKKNNPYKYLFLVYDFREKSLSNNVYNKYKRISKNSYGDTLSIGYINSVFQRYNENNYPEIDELNSYLYYSDCN